MQAAWTLEHLKRIHMRHTKKTTALLNWADLLWVEED
jgi:hypothetical protein